MAEYIVRDGETGLAMVSSTGTPVDDILEAVETRGTLEAALALDPRLTEEAVVVAVRFARIAVRNGGMYPPPDPTLGVMELRERAVAYAGWEPGDTVAVPVHEYDDLRYRLDLLEGIFEAEGDLEQGRGVPHDEVMARLRARFGG